jgi:hypothetical protein
VSIGLIGYDGVLLAVNGSLTTDPNCCCDVPPSPCPPCCIRIDWGSFNSDGDLVGEYVVADIPIAVKMVMPTKNSRIICDNDQVTVRWELDAPADEYGAWVRFGPGWGFVGESPVVGEAGETYEWGLVDWVGTSADAFQVTLTFRKCFMDAVQFHYFIVIGTDSPEWDLDIDATRCATTSECCPEEVDCEDCCALLNQEDVIKHGGKYYIVVNTVGLGGDIYTGVIEFELERAGILCKGEGIDITLWLVPPRHEEIENNTIIEFPSAWNFTFFSPVVSDVDGEATEIKVDWGTLTEYRYDISLVIDCVDTIPVLTFPTITITNIAFGISNDIKFIDCDMEGCCGVVVPCCEVAIPRILNVAITQDVPGTCECADGGAFTLEYDDATERWEGSGDFGTCGTTIAMRVWCHSLPGGGQEWRVEIDACSGNFGGGLAVFTPDSCDPFAADVSTFGSLDDCCAGDPFSQPMFHITG